MRYHLPGSLLIAAFAIACLPRLSTAATRIVPDQFATIQAAMVASAPSGDSVLVRPGTYMEAVDFLGKDIVLRSLAGPEVTIIDAAGRPSSAVYMEGVGSGAKVKGFTIKNGSGSINVGWAGGGGVHSSDAVGDGPVIEDNWITGNIGYFGGGILLAGPARVIGNRITNNHAAREGGGVWAAFPNTGTALQTISGNEIFGNDTYGNSQFGGGMYVAGNHRSIVEGNVVACNVSNVGGGAAIGGTPNGRTIAGNTFFANWGRAGVGGIWFNSNIPVEVTNNAIVYNLGGGVECRDIFGSGIDAECNDIFGNNPDIVGEACGEVIGVNNNFRADPLFGSALGCPPPTGAGAFCLTTDSPLLPANSPPGCGLIGARGLCAQIGIADETPAPEAERNHVSAQPNPFATRTTLVIDLVAPSEIELRITNALGRAVAEQSLGTLHAGRHRWTWDGRDAAGRNAPAGVYYAEVQAGGRSVVTRLMVLR